ncbi:MAG: hypothetical protein ACYC26_04905 [Phycisphaerales bacterium]
MLIQSPRLLFCCLTLLSGLTAGFTAFAQEQVIVKVDPADKILDSMIDKPLDPYRAELLDLAFDTATAIPVQPHIKSRSHQQENVVNACLQLDQAGRAARFLKKIDNWRRGSAYGELALYCLRHGRGDGVQDLLNTAAEITRIADQDWRESTILAKIAQAKVLMGQVDEARKMEADFEPVNQGAVAQAQATRVDDKTLDEQMKHLDQVVAGAKFDALVGAIGVYAQMYDTYFKDIKRRELIEAKLREAWKGLPLFMHIESLMNMAGYCARKDEPAMGLKFVQEARGLVDGAQWPIDYYVPMMGRMASVRARCGDIDGSKRDLEKTLEEFEKHRGEFPTFEQAGAIRPIAEAYQVMGDHDKSLQVYQRAVELGSMNPNARCRAEDLTTTCLSMAMNAIEPDGELWKRMRQIRAGLDNPW